MKFLCDVHISYKLVRHLKMLGFDVIHVNEILDKWFTSDIDICQFADEQNRIVITKDSDFRDSFYINKTPRKLIKLNLGNISNSELIKIFSEYKTEIEIINHSPIFIIEIEKNNLTFNVPEE